MLTFKNIQHSWNEFFFTERPTYNLAIFRILWGSLIFFNILAEFGNVEDFYGPAGMVSFSTAKGYLNSFHFSLFQIFQESLFNTYLIYFVTLISLFFVTIGLFSRTALFLAFLGIVSLHMRNIWILSSADVLIRCVFMILVWSPCYNVLSLDSIIASKRGMPLPIKASQWTWRLLQIQICVVYLWTFWSKIKGDAWFDGSAVYYATRLETLKHYTLPWVLDNKYSLMFLTWSSLLTEVALGILVWFNKTRKPVIIAGVIFHLGIEYVMAIPFFEWIMIVLLLNFFTPEEYASLMMKLKEKMKATIAELEIKEEIKLNLLKMF